MKKKTQKPFWEMTPAERTAATKQFDKETPSLQVRPLAKSERERFERARSARGSIFVSGKKKKVTVQLDAALLSRLDQLAEQKGISRDAIFELGFRGLLAFAS